MITLLGFLGGVALTTIFFLIREIRLKRQMSDMWEEIYEFEDRMTEEVNYIEDTIQTESTEQWDDVHAQWSHINEFEDRLFDILNDELDDLTEDKVNYIRNNKKEPSKKIDEEARIDEILTKISKSGMSSLTPDELKFLNKKKK